MLATILIISLIAFGYWKREDLSKGFQRLNLSTFVRRDEVTSNPITSTTDSDKGNIVDGNDVASPVSYYSGLNEKEAYQNHTYSVVYYPTK